MQTDGQSAAGEAGEYKTDRKQCSCKHTGRTGGNEGCKIRATGAVGRDGEAACERARQVEEPGGEVAGSREKSGWGCVELLTGSAQLTSCENGCRAGWSACERREATVAGPVGVLTMPSLSSCRGASSFLSIRLNSLTNSRKWRYDVLMCAARPNHSKHQHTHSAAVQPVAAAAGGG